MSPSLFSLHTNGQGIENLTSLPNLFKSFTGEDQQAWLDLIIESSGVRLVLSVYLSICQYL
jgi:hypothetical protein